MSLNPVSNSQQPESRSVLVELGCTLSEGLYKAFMPCDQYCSELIRKRNWQADVPQQEWARQISSCMKDCKDFQYRFDRL